MFLELISFKYEVMAKEFSMGKQGDLSRTAYLCQLIRRPDSLALIGT